MDALKILGTHATQIAWGAGIFAGSLVFSILAAVLVVLRLPATYFHADEPPPFWPDRPPWMRYLARAGKNLLGLALAVLGLVMMLPGVPGQGLLTLFIGLTLLDFPGKRRLERRIVRIPAILRGINRLRTRFGREPITLDPGDTPRGDDTPHEGEA